MMHKTILAICITSQLFLYSGLSQGEDKKFGENLDITGSDYLQFHEEIDRTRKGIGNKSRGEVEDEFRMVVGRYIYPGMSFESAAYVLRKEGFDLTVFGVELGRGIGAFPEHGVPKSGTKVTAILRVANGLLFRSLLSVDLYPIKPDDFEKIQKTSVGFTTDTP